MHADMHLLYELQQLDARIEKMRSNLNALDSGESLRQKLDHNRQRLENIKRQYHELTFRAREQELELKSQEEKLRQLEAELYSGRIRNPKELESLQHEIDYLKKKRENLDMEVLRIWEQMETTEVEIRETEAEMGRMEQLYQKHLEHYHALKSAIEEELARLLSLREGLVARIQPSAVERYERLRERVGGVAVALVEEKTCRVCHTALTDYAYKRLESETNLLTCESCGRLLFDPNLGAGAVKNS